MLENDGGPRSQQNRYQGPHRDDPGPGTRAAAPYVLTARSLRGGFGSMTQTTDAPAAGLAEIASPVGLGVAPRVPRVLAIANQKGGVGKTTTAINLGTALAAIGEQVLIVDLDPQGNASTGLGIDRRSRRHSTYDVLIGEARRGDGVLPPAVPRLFIAPSTLDLSGLELQIGQARDRAFRLRNAFAPLNAGRPDAVDFTYVLVDCP